MAHEIILHNNSTKNEIIFLKRKATIFVLENDEPPAAQNRNQDPFIILPDRSSRRSARIEAIDDSTESLKHVIVTKRWITPPSEHDQGSLYSSGVEVERRTRGVSLDHRGTSEIYPKDTEDPEKTLA